MFHNSTQKEHWMFESERHLTRIRAETNAGYCQKHFEEAIKKQCQFLTASEEQLLCKYYMKKLLKFCNHFRPSVPRSVLGTVCSYFKRFYLYSSVMEFHPKDIQLAKDDPPIWFCCAYIAFKTEEYNVSIDEFVQILPKEMQDSVAKIALENELLLLRKLKFHLIVHSPFRPLEGLIIDLKTKSNVANPDCLRGRADQFLLDSLHSDAALLYPPSQIALSALYHSARHSDIDLSSYIRSSLLNNKTDEHVAQLFQSLQDIEDLVKNIRILEYHEVAHIEDQLRIIQSISNQPQPQSGGVKRKSEESAADDVCAKRPRNDDQQLVSEGVIPSMEHRGHYYQQELEGIQKM